MGGGSSSSSQQQSTDTRSLYLSGTDGVTVAGSDNVDVSITQTDHGAVQGGLDVAKLALDGYQQTSRDLFGFLKDNQTQTTKALSTANADNLAVVSNFAREALATAKNSDSQQALDSFIKLGTVAVAVVGVAYAIRS